MSAGPKGDPTLPPDAAVTALPVAVAWAVASSWRGDRLLFARVVRKAQTLLTDRGLNAPCCIEFAIKRDNEQHCSAESLETATPQALRSFSSARIRVGDPGLLIQVELGRKPDKKAVFACGQGVSIRVTSSSVERVGDVAEIRDQMLPVMERLSFTKLETFVTGPSAEHDDLDRALVERTTLRRTALQFAMLVVSLATLVIAVVAFQLLTARKSVGGFSISLASFSELAPVATVLAQIGTFFLTTTLFPAVEISDQTPGRRLIGFLGRSGLVTIPAGLLGAYLKTVVSG